MQKDSETISLKKIIVDYLYHWKVFLVAACISLVCAILYMVIYPQTYEFVARIKIQEDKNLGSGGSMEIFRAGAAERCTCFFHIAFGGRFWYDKLE